MPLKIIKYQNASKKKREEEEEEVEEDQDYEFPIGPMPQHITNDLKSLDEMVSLLVSQYRPLTHCTFSEASFGLRIVFH